MVNCSIIIPTRDNVSSLQSIIESIFKDKLFTSTNYEIIVANDGNRNDITNFVNDTRNKGVNISEVLIEKSLGSYFARNRAIQRSSGEWIIIFDSGLTISRDWFLKLQPYLQMYDYIGGDVKIQFRQNMSVGEKFDFLYSFPMRLYLEKFHFGGAGYLIVKREVFNKVGLFNEKLYSGGDGEFGVRVFNSGFKQGFFPDAPAFHPPRNFVQQFYKKIRVIKGHYDQHILNNSDRNPLKFNILALIVSPFFVTVKDVRRYLFNTDQREIISLLPFIWGSFIFNSINSYARLYVRLNKNKIINT